MDSCLLGGGKDLCSDGHICLWILDSLSTTCVCINQNCVKSNLARGFHKQPTQSTCKVVEFAKDLESSRQNYIIKM